MQAHHIVAGSSPKAAQARAILQKYGVDINDAANGTFLLTVKGVAEGAYHPSLHTNAYYDKINKLLSDAPGFTFLVFSRRALECLEPLISENVEILPLDFDGKRIMAFKKYVFLPNVIESVSIFKISDEKTRYAFVSNEFKQTAEKNNLLGFKFTLVWDSEQE